MGAQRISQQFVDEDNAVAITLRQRRGRDRSAQEITQLFVLGGLHQNDWKSGSEADCLKPFALL